MGPLGKPKYRVVRQLLREGATIDFFAKQCPVDNNGNIEELEQQMERYLTDKQEKPHDPPEFPEEAFTDLWEDYVNCIDMVQGKG